MGARHAPLHYQLYSIIESAMVNCVPVTQEAVAYCIVELLQNPTLLASLRQEFQNNVSHETWDKIPQVWVKNF